MVLGLDGQPVFASGPIAFSLLRMVTEPPTERRNNSGTTEKRKLISFLQTSRRTREPLLRIQRGLDAGAELSIETDVRLNFN